MATILEFQRSVRKTTAAGQISRSGRDCEVVLFPGVRYQRWGDAPSQERVGARRHEHLDLDN